MKFQITRQINVPDSKVWEELWDRYHNVCDWASTVNKLDAREVGSNYKNGRTCTSTWGEVSEIVDSADEENMTYSYYADRLPSMMKSAKNSWKVVAKSVNVSEVVMTGNIVFAPLPGLLMGWMMKPKMRKDLEQTLDDFKYYMETGRQTEAKKKSDTKFNKKKGNKAA
ncbi:SRPBCC family protein [Spongiimicrobium sp. 2-473A-2-J]|uniref:SRPBCC family protein n=1 Tax=Eudoraea algarum TaxID=3417568 RepID=UPI003D366748